MAPYREMVKRRYLLALSAAIVVGVAGGIASVNLLKGNDRPPVAPIELRGEDQDQERPRGDGKAGQGKRPGQDSTSGPSKRPKGGSGLSGFVPPAPEPGAVPAPGPAPAPAGEADDDDDDDADDDTGGDDDSGESDD